MWISWDRVNCHTNCGRQATDATVQMLHSSSWNIIWQVQGLDDEWGPMGRRSHQKGQANVQELTASWEKRDGSDVYNSSWTMWPFKVKTPNNFMLQGQDIGTMWAVETTDFESNPWWTCMKMLMSEPRTEKLQSRNWRLTSFDIFGGSISGLRKSQRFSMTGSTKSITSKVSKISKNWWPFSRYYEGFDFDGDGVEYHKAHLSSEANWKCSNSGVSSRWCLILSNWDKSHHFLGWYFFSGVLSSKNHNWSSNLGPAASSCQIQIPGRKVPAREVVEEAVNCCAGGSRPVRWNVRLFKANMQI